MVDIWVLTAALCKNINKMFRKVERKKEKRGRERKTKQTDMALDDCYFVPKR